MGACACAQGQHIVELGCGCGLVGLVFAALGARVLLTDLAETQARSGPCVLVHAKTWAATCGALIVRVACCCCSLACYDNRQHQHISRLLS